MGASSKSKKFNPRKGLDFHRRAVPLDALAALGGGRELHRLCHVRVRWRHVSQEALQLARTVALGRIPVDGLRADRREVEWLLCLEADNRVLQAAPLLGIRADVQIDT